MCCGTLIPRRPRPDLGRGQPHQCELAIALSAQRTRALARPGTAAHSHAQGCARAGASGRLQLLDGIDPIDARRAERAKATQVVTFKAAAEAYNALHEQKWRNAKHRKQFLASLACYAYPVLGEMTVSTIDTAAVLRVVEPIWLSKTETANRVRGRIESVLDWATVRGHRSGDNPARWKGHLAGVLPAPGAVAQRKHYPALPWSQIAAFMAELRMREGVAARALEFTILTAARTGEVVGARWSEIDLETRTWVIPAARMKSRREHRVPLSPRAIECGSRIDTSLPVTRTPPAGEGCIASEVDATTCPIRAITGFSTLTPAIGAMHVA